GTAMRDAGVDVFEYISARDVQQGICIGLFTPSAFTQKSPTEMTAWLCEVSANEVAFKQRDKGDVIRFSLKNFMVNGELPLPAI
ncbi:MAG TPA: RES domain-containing protein, partial [Cellvibrio sp.]